MDLFDVCKYLQQRNYCCPHKHLLALRGPNPAKFPWSCCLCNSRLWTALLKPPELMYKNCIYYVYIQYLVPFFMQALCFISSICSRGLQCFKLNGNQTENDRYWQKNNFYFLQNVWKCTVFFAFAFKVYKKCYYDTKNFCTAKYQHGYQKTQNFMLISNSLMPT